MDPANQLLKRKRIGFLGVGNMGQALITALIETNTVEADRISAFDAIDGKAKKFSEKHGIQCANSAEEVVESTEIVFLAIKPQDLSDAIEPIAMSFSEKHLVVSLAAGFPLSKLKQILSQAGNVARIMPNTPVKVKKAVIGYALAQPSELDEETLELLLSPMAYLVPTPEGEKLEGLTVACGSGPGFVFEFMKYWQDWLEDYGFKKEEARRMTVDTFLGAAILADSQPSTEINELQERVASKKGVTQAGLDSFRENEMERILRLSFEKAVQRDRELAQNV
jgi:pyrroline-5-carboxylate reductase